ncbi:DsbA family protein [Anaeromyxobacter oryzisoli]|uniref:DsbA family protein n=1 Tax=Anaeromyxobacter oryzisoli TaxID=2925408 RepID=UPI001F58BFED|nr:thioredoxin domain-containing protein [Anaeromyxobacter sp. SG63]
MKIASSTLLAALAAGGLLACRSASSAAAPGAPPAAPASEAPLPAGASPEEVVPGVSLEGLTPAQKTVVAEYARTEFCHCGCPHTISQCLRTHHACKHAARQARLGAQVAAAGVGLAELKKVLGDYYASFDTRARLDTTGFGPPLGNADARITIVELSDFTCPFCRQLRPALEAFVRERADRVKLFYKPFPIESHPGALEAAQAGEWARDAGVFWPMHDALFMTTDHGLDGLAEAARQAGGDEADLRDALATQKYLAKVRGSQAEARAAGLRGTPTLYFEGRHHLLDFSPEALERSLEDEEEWQQHHGWERD